MFFPSFFEITLPLLVQGAKASFVFIPPRRIYGHFSLGLSNQLMGHEPAFPGCLHSHHVLVCVCVTHYPCFLRSAASHAGDDWDHQTAGGEDLRSRRVLVSVRRLEHHRHPEEPESLHQTCLWVHFKTITVSVHGCLTRYLHIACQRLIRGYWQNDLFFSPNPRMLGRY